MKATYYVRSGQIVIDVTHDEFDVLALALKALEFSAISAEADEKKLRLIDSMNEDIRKLETNDR